MAKGQPLIDITGQKFHMLTCIGFSHMDEPRPDLKRGGRSWWRFKCDCGNEIVARKDQVIYSWSHHKSCGCYGRQERSRRIAEYNKTEEKRQQISGDNHWIHKSDWRPNQNKKTGRFIK